LSWEHWVRCCCFYCCWFYRAEFARQIDELYSVNVHELRTWKGFELPLTSNQSILIFKKRYPIRLHLYGFRTYFQKSLTVFCKNIIEYKWKFHRDWLINREIFEYIWDVGEKKSPGPQRAGAEPLCCLFLPCTAISNFGVHLTVLFFLWIRWPNLIVIATLSANH